MFLSIFGYFEQQVQLNWAVPALYNESIPSTPFSMNSKVSLAAWTIPDIHISPNGATSITDGQFR